MESLLEKAARIKSRTWYHDEKQVIHVTCSPYETDKTHVKRQLGRGRKNVSSRRESFVLVIVCRGRASTINAKREHKGRKNSTKPPQFRSRYILKRYRCFRDRWRAAALLLHILISRRNSSVCPSPFSDPNQAGSCKLFISRKNFHNGKKGVAKNIRNVNE